MKNKLREYTGNVEAMVEKGTDELRTAHDFYYAFAQQIF
jgi:hypothetical protein